MEELQNTTSLTDGETSVISTSETTTIELLEKIEYNTRYQINQNFFFSILLFLTIIIATFYKILLRFA